MKDNILFSNLYEDLSKVPIKIHHLTLTPHSIHTENLAKSESNSLDGCI